jgi:putative membrane protein
MMYYGHGMGAWGMALMTVSSVLFWALVIAGVVAIVRYTGRDAQYHRPVTPGPAPQQMLAERFARGDIDEEEYQRRRQVLDETAPPRGPGG